MRRPELCLSHGYLWGLIIRQRRWIWREPNQVMADDSATIRVPVETPHSLTVERFEFEILVGGRLLILVELNIQKILFFFFVWFLYCVLYLTLALLYFFFPARSNKLEMQSILSSQLF